VASCSRLLYSDREVRAQGTPDRSETHAADLKLRGPAPATPPCTSLPAAGFRFKEPA